MADEQPEDNTEAPAPVEHADDAVAGGDEVVPATADEQAEVAALSSASDAAVDEPDAVAAESDDVPEPVKAKGTASAPVSIEERVARREAERADKAAQRRRFRARARGRRAEQRAATPAQEAILAPEHGSGRPKTRQGVVVSAKPDKTISVRVDMARRHPRYHKIMRSSSTLHVHDERNDASEGDTVRVVECRPMSRSKRWRLIEVVERAR